MNAHIYQEIKKAFDTLDAKNDFLDFLYRRIKSDNYRGGATAQHNRYTLREVKFLLSEIINNYDNYLAIPPGDSGTFPSGYQDYIDFSKSYAQEFGKGNSENTIKKNLFPDFATMGFLVREKRGRSISHVYVSSLGKELLAASEINSKIIYSGAINRIFHKWIDYMVSILANANFQHLHKYEIMLIVSAIGSEFEFSINEAKAIELINCFRSLGKGKIESLLSTLSRELVPQKFDGTKTDKRDFHNWENKLDQFVHMIKEGLWFEYDEKSEKLSMRAKVTVSGDEIEIEKILRSNQEKTKYFTEHGVTKNNYPGFELHHIIEFSEIKEINQIALIDTWKNLILIDGLSHNKISIASRKGIKQYWFTYDDNFVSLSDKNTDSSIDLIFDINVAIGKKHLNSIEQYNHDLYNAIFS